MDLNLTILLGRVAGRAAMPFSSMLDNDLAIIFDSESYIVINNLHRTISTFNITDTS